MDENLDTGVEIYKDTFKKSGITLCLKKRLIEEPVTIDVNGQPVTISPGTQYILSIQKSEPYFFRKTSWFVDANKKVVDVEEFSRTLMEHMLVLLHESIDTFRPHDRIKKIFEEKKDH